MRVLALLPAHNEEAGIIQAIYSLLTQSRPPDTILVVADNCTDHTVSLARAVADDVPEVHVIETVGNTARKAGALNAGIRHAGGSHHYTLTMDADTVLHRDFIRNAVALLEADPMLGGLSATCEGRTGLGATRWERLICALQRGEYARYAALRGSADIHTMSGAGSVYRWDAIAHVIRHRGHLFDERPSNIVEDYELTLQLKAMGWRVGIHSECRAETDLMPTVRSLIAQRQRWVRGTIDEIRRRGLTRHTRRSAGQLLAGLAIPLLVYGLFVRLVWAASAGYEINLWWLAVWFGVNLAASFAELAQDSGDPHLQLHRGPEPSRPRRAPPGGRHRPKARLRPPPPLLELLQPPQVLPHNRPTMEITT